MKFWNFYFMVSCHFWNF